MFSIFKHKNNLNEINSLLVKITNKNFGKATKDFKPFNQFPYFFEKTKKIKEYPDFSDPKVQSRGPVNIRYKKSIKPARVYEIKPPQKDFIDFKKMTGNEILLNLENMDYFRTSEKINALLELSHRISLPENSSVKNEAINNYNVKKLISDVLKILKSLNVSHFLNFFNFLNHIIIIKNYFS
jgi:hypothetical protein